jgi:hypothetical protein
LNIFPGQRCCFFGAICDRHARDQLRHDEASRHKSGARPLAQLLGGGQFFVSPKLLTFVKLPVPWSARIQAQDRFVLDPSLIHVYPPAGQVFI